MANVTTEWPRDGSLQTRFGPVAERVPVIILIPGRIKGCSDFNKNWLNLTGRPPGES
jgi:hypothetical protein